MSNDVSIPKIWRLRARRFRNATNESEKYLWRHLRRFLVEGSHFRRQVPIGPYVADFACMAARLIIELDGSQHGIKAISLRDKARTRWLEKEGFRVIRVWNSEIKQNINGVLQKIYAEIYGSLDAETIPLKHRRRRRALNSHPTPRPVGARPSPSRGG